MKPLCFFQAEDGRRGRSPSRGLGDVYKRQLTMSFPKFTLAAWGNLFTQIGF